MSPAPRTACRMAATLFLLACGPAVHPARAHEFNPAIVSLVETTPGRFRVHWAGRSEGPSTLSLPPHCAPQRVTAPASVDVDCGSTGLRGARLAVATGLPGAFVRVTFLDGTSAGGTVHRAAPEWQVPGVGTALGVGDTLRRYATLGIAHIGMGMDHLLFVLALLLMLRNAPAVVATLTAFTVAHSLTLALAVLDVVRVPPAPVEALIALSIVVVARELAVPETDQPTLARRRPWLLALAFGLLHGLGFAGALREAGLPHGSVLVALLSFNLGVEIGQLVFAAAALPLVGAWRARCGARPLLRALPAYAIGIVAAAWVIGRVAEP